MSVARVRRPRIVVVARSVRSGCCGRVVLLPSYLQGFISPGLRSRLEYFARRVGTLSVRRLIRPPVSGAGGVLATACRCHLGRAVEAAEQVERRRTTTRGVYRPLGTDPHPGLLVLLLYIHSGVMDVTWLASCITSHLPCHGGCVVVSLTSRVFA